MEKKEFDINNNSLYTLISDHNHAEILKILIEKLVKEHNFSIEQIHDLVKTNEITIPISVFDNKELSALETISKYLKEELNFRYCKIGVLLNRDERTIWGSYNAAGRKRPAKLKIKDSISIPISIFIDRKFSVLESLVRYLKERHDLTYHQVAVLLNRDDRTIWTVYYRVKKKEVISEA